MREDEERAVEVTEHETGNRETTYRSHVGLLVCILLGLLIGKLIMIVNPEAIQFASSAPGVMEHPELAGQEFLTNFFDGNIIAILRQYINIWTAG